MRAADPIDAELTLLQAHFCEFSVMPGVSLAAAYRLAARKEVSGAKQLANQLLQIPAVVALRAELRAAQSERTGVSADRVLEEHGVLAFSSIDHYVIDELGHVALTDTAPRSAMRAVSKIKRKRRVIPMGEDAEIVEYETEIALWDKNPPLTNLGRYHGIYKDRLEHSGRIALEDILAAAKAPDPAGPV